METDNSNRILFILFAFALLVLFIVNLSIGAVEIPFIKIVGRLLGYSTGNETWDYIILNFRFPKAITAILAGIALSVSGLMMQTLFRNPLAGPDVLGLTSGSGLGVAFVVLGAAFLPATISEIATSPFATIIASCLGSFLVLIAVLLVSQKLRNTMAILIIGLMFGSLASAIVSVLTFYSSAEQLQRYAFWALGNLSNMSWEAIFILFISVAIGLGISIFSIKPLNALLLGENYAKSMGLNFKRSRLLIIIATSLLAGSITAFVGPIAFIGLAVPHIAKLIFKTSNHAVLLIATVLLGAIALLLCDCFSQLPGTDIILPINAITSILGAPIVIWLLVRNFKNIAE